MSENCWFVSHFLQTYNMACMYERFQDNMEIYTLNPNPHEAPNDSSELTPETWIIFIMRREVGLDYSRYVHTLIVHLSVLNSWNILPFRQPSGPDISISTPNSATVTSYVKDSFTNWKLMDWKEPYIFTALPRPISFMFTKISILKGNVTVTHPTYLYHCPREDALAFDTG
jgi:hypothetical protein